MDVGYITSLQAVRLGQVIENISSRFDTDSELRFQVIAHGATRNALPLTGSEVEDLAYKRIRDLPTMNIPCKRIRGYLIMLDHYIGLVEGNGIPRIVTDENVEIIKNAEILRDFWLSELEYAGKVRAMRDALAAAVEMFAHQCLLEWIRTILNRQLKQPSFLEGLTLNEFNKQHSVVDSYIYTTGRMLVAGDCRKAYTVLAQMPQIRHEIGRLFFITPAQMDLLFLAELGKQIDPEDFFNLELPIDSPKKWQQQISRLFVLE